MPPNLIHYRIEWKLMINKTVVSKNTEEDIVLEPTSHGPHILLPYLEELLKRKVPSPRSATAEDTGVRVKVAERSEDDFVTPCELKPFCWFDSQRNKRFGLKSHHLQSLIRDKDDGKPLDTHNQMPEEL